MSDAEMEVKKTWLDELLNEDVTQDKLTNKCCDISKGIQNRKAGLLELIEKLGPILTDKNPELRKNGIQVFAAVLQNLPQNFLQTSELHFTTTFFCDRLKDHSTIIPVVLQGILAVAQMNNLPKDAPVQIVTAMFQHVHCQTHRQADRNIIYKILQLFLQNYEEELKQLGPDFVFGVMSIIDGERDPRNLLLIFGMLPHFLKTFPLGHLTEDMFEVVSCYFPIDFYSVPNDPDAVTRDELAAALLPCLIAVPDFAEFCIPLLLEKLDSSLRIARVDSLRVLQECCKIFTVEKIQKEQHNLFCSLQKIAVYETDKEVCREALAALKELTHMITVVPFEKNQATLLLQPLKDIVASTREQLQKVELNLFLPTTRMLFTIAEGSPAACELVLKEVTCTLLNQYHDCSSLERKVVLLKTLTIFLAVCEKQNVQLSDITELASSWVNIPILYLTAVQHNKSEIRKEGIHGFLITARSLSLETRQQVYKLLCNCIKREDSVEVRQEVVDCLKELAKLYPDEIMEEVIFSGLQWNQDPGSGDAHDILILSRCADVLCEIAVAEPFTTCILPQILSLIFDVYQVEKCDTGIRCLRKLVESSEAGPNLHRYLYMQCGAVSQLVSWWLQGICEDNHPQIFHNEQLLLDTAKILSTILRTQTESIQFDVITEFVPRFLDPVPKPEDNNFKPLNASSPWHHTQSVVLLEALLSPVRQCVNLASLSRLVVKLQTLSVHTSHSLTSRSAARLVACLINKAHDDELLSILLSDLKVLLLATLDCDHAPSEDIINAANLFSWITKALIVRGHRETDVWVHKMVEMLSRDAVGLRIKEGFKLIMIEKEEYMNSDNYCNIRVLYRQRFFQTVPKLVDHYHQAADHVRSNHLVALAYMLQGVPKVVLNVNLAEFIPLLVESLGQREVVLLLSTLEILRDLLESKQTVLEEHIQTFLTRFLHLSQFQDSLKVRITALQCVLQICNYPTHLLLPFKQQTINDLGCCLDDPKRLVRQQAVATRSRWYLIGAPGEPSNS